MHKLLRFAILIAAASAPKWALAQVTEPLRLPYPLPPALADTLPPVQITGYLGTRRSTTCDPVVVTTRTDDLFFPVTNIQLLLSRMPGVQVTPSSGAPGDWATVRIRGSGLRGADQPLYLIDGLPALNADFAPVQVAPLPIYDWGSGPQVSAAAPNPLLFVSPQDIDHVEILKGAAAATRYGSQGANGVILITTKSGGKAGVVQAPQLHYEAFAGVQQVRQRVALLDARQYADLANEVWRNAGSQGPPPFDAAALAGLGHGTDWQGELFGAALLQSHHLSLGGSTARTRYLASADYLGQHGVVLNSALHRYGLRLNLDHTFTPKLRLWLRVAGAAIDRTLPPAGTVPGALLAPPTVPATTGGEPTNTSTGYPLQPGYAAAFLNPLALSKQAYTTDATRRLLAQAGASWQLAPTLRLEGQLSEELATTGATNRALRLPYNTPGPLAGSDILRTTQRLGTTNAQASLFYQRAGAPRHALGAEATLLLQRMSRVQEQIDLATGNPFNNSSINDYSLTILSALATATYSYDERLHLAATLRADRATVAQYALGTNGQVQLYPGLAASWTVDQEHFLRGSRVVSSLRLLAAVGQCSNTSITATSFPAGPTASPIVSVIELSTPALARTTQVNAGVVAGFLGNKLVVEPSLYSHHTAHANVAQALPIPAGQSLNSYELITRAVTLRNQGVELAVTSYLSSAGGKVASTIRLAAAHNQQTALAIEGALAVPGLAVGESLHPYFGYQRAGLGPTGALQYRDANGDGRVNYQDTSYFGNGLPSWLLNFSQELKLNRWALQTQFDALLGYQLLSPVLARLDYPSATTNGSPRLLDRWTPTHNDTVVPAASFYGQPGSYDNLSAESAGHLRLSQLTLSYQLRPTDAPRPVQVWVGAQNLFVLTSYRGYDPNVSSGGGLGQLAGYDASQYPVARVWQAGVRASF